MINVVFIQKFLVQEWRRPLPQIVVFDIRASRRCCDVSGDSAVGLVFLFWFHVFQQVLFQSVVVVLLRVTLWCSGSNIDQSRTEKRMVFLDVSGRCFFLNSVLASSSSVFLDL